MKNIHILYMMFLVPAFFACNDIFDRAPLDKVSYDAVWSDPVYIDANLAQLYAETPFNYSENGQQINAIAYWGGEMLGNAAGMVSWIQGTLTNTGGHMEYWPYTKIRNINTFLVNIEDAEVEADIKSTRKAEARFLRAWHYFEMVKRYGGIPLITVPQSLDLPEEELFVSRNTEKEIYDFISKECDEIADVLPEVAVDYGRVTKYAALALKSRAMLYAGSIATFGKQQLDGLLGFPSGEAGSYYQKSYDASKAIINSGLFALYNKHNDKAKNYQYIWLDERNEETIFAKAYNGRNNVAHSWDYFSYPGGFQKGWGGEANPYLEMVEAYDYNDGTSGILDRANLKDTLVDIHALFANKDPRFFGTVLYQEAPFKDGLLLAHSSTIVDGEEVKGNTVVGEYNGENWLATSKSVTKNYTNGTGFACKKFAEERIDQPQKGESATDYIIYRYAETLLNLAEAALELNKPDEALAAINQVRARAGMPAHTSIDRDKINKERRVELALEGHRFWDVRRWRIAEKELSESRNKMKTVMDWSTKKYQISFEPADEVVRDFTEKQYYLPINVARISNNKNLAPENPGY